MSVCARCSVKCCAGVVASVANEVQQLLGPLAGLFSTVSLPALPYADQLFILGTAFPKAEALLPLAFASQLLCQLLTGQARAASLDR